MIFSLEFRSEIRRRAFSAAWMLGMLAAALCSGCDSRVVVHPRENHPAPLPPHRFYVAKSFSVVTESGVTGFPAGKEVTRIREENGDFIISDGRQLVRAPKSSFTRDFEAVRRKQKSGKAGEQTTPP